MMSGPDLLCTAAEVLVWRSLPSTVSIVTWTPCFLPHSAACRWISASAAGTKLLHCRSWSEPVYWRVDTVGCAPPAAGLAPLGGEAGRGGSVGVAVPPQA